MSQTHEEVTVHGNVEYETVECAACGHDVVDTNAKRVYIGDVKDVTAWNHKNSKEISFDSRTVEWIRLCDTCTEFETDIATALADKRVRGILIRVTAAMLLAWGTVVAVALWVIPP